ncbi:MAG: imidazole glycerol phosphate synthase subunit HisF [Caldithrix sp.]|nr:imidazole glycerol phosphate synthase subunit HisF [Caldithrix sp.]
MLTKRIIPCLDIKDGTTVKGIKFVDIREAGNPVDLGKRYAAEGADELVFLDITATIEERPTFVQLVKDIALNVNIPFTVGGGIRTENDVSELLNAGADKVTINSAAVKNPELIDTLARRFGSQCVVLAIDTHSENQQWEVYIHGGRKPTALKTMEWAAEAAERGAGEILLTSMNHDGTRDGFAIEITHRLSTSLSIPVIASGGAGSMTHFYEVFEQGAADAALAASVFHFGEIPIPDLKHYLKSKNITVRL